MESDGKRWKEVDSDGKRSNLDGSHKGRFLHASIEGLDGVVVIVSVLIVHLEEGCDAKEGVSNTLRV